ncbi:hypothetical protein, partial [Candidatus Symbiopectobacterium sp. NZEC135]|uniref:hypothetical protein n=1 Tax=Candidatus Symbiopectobacterium sp. NZEC135 TaxID=2820471 RepID=UPI0022274E52
MSHFMTVKQTASIAAWLMLFSAQASQANTLTIGKGSGVVWQGSPFSVNNLSITYQNDSTILTSGGIAAISDLTTDCISTTKLSTINSTQAYTISQGVGIVPIATALTTLTVGATMPVEIAALTGTIGLNGTQGTYTSNSTSGNAIVPTNRGWCLSFADHGSPFPFTIFGNERQTANISGLWAIVTDGTQRTGTYVIPPMYAITSTPSNSQSQIIQPYTLLRVTAIACLIATTTSVNFGTAARNTTQFAELANVTAPLTVTCDHDAPHTIDTN